MRFQII